MRALVHDGEGVRLDARHAVPELKPGEALIRPTRVAVSGLDAAIGGGMNGFTGVLGRSFVGFVEQVEDSSQKQLHGKRVIGSSVTWCGQCDMCTSGFRTHCRHRTMIGIHGRDGCLAERVAMPIGTLHELPGEIDDDRAVFANYLAAALQAARQLTIQGKPYITVLGDGPLGLLTAQVMARLNASVRLLGRHVQKLGLCEKWAVKHRHIDEVGRRADQDVVVDCTGTFEGLMTAMALVRPRGSLVMKSLLPPTGPATDSVDLSPIVLNELNIIGSWCGPLNEAVNELRRGEVDVLSLISRRMKLSEGPSILQAAGRTDTVTVLVDV